ncbi:MAG: radical SAM protein [Deltaproteobacteria bacterium]|nr:radical SAM protein [Deltaproteobacteria bacterium]
MNIIYEPKGPALEYAPLALNIYNGCTHGCRYCYAASALRISHEEFFREPNPKKNVIERVKKDATNLAAAGDQREILISFIGDPYQPAEKELQLTRSVIGILIDHGLTFCILTKGADLAMRDFDLLQDYPKVRFGVTLTMHKPENHLYWELDADGVFLRRRALMVAHDFGIKTWASIEPVIYPQEAYDLIEDTIMFVDHYKIGKLNHFPEYEKTVDWLKFRTDVINLLEEWEVSYYIKKSLRNL